MIDRTVISAGNARGRFIGYFIALAVSLICAATAPAQAQSGSSGEFTWVVGRVMIERAGRSVPAVRGATVQPQDVIVTGADGMAQLAMIDGARLSLRSNSQLRVQQYPTSVNDQPGAALTLLNGTLRTFTAALTPRNRAAYQLNTKIATIGIRGSGGILEHQGDTTNHYTIEGSHVVASADGKFAPIISFPNQTVQIVPGQPPKLIPTPPSLLAAGAVAKESKKTAASAEAAAENTAVVPPPAGVAAADAVTPPPQTGSAPGFTVVDASGSLGVDSLLLQSIVIAAGGSLASDIALPSAITLEQGGLRAYSAYGASQSGTGANIAGGTARDVQTVSLGGNTSMVIGRWDSVSSFGFGAGNGGTGGAVGGSVHFAYGGAGYPAYLSDVLTGTATYTRQAATTPTNQFGTLGALTTATLDVNFTARTLNAVIGVTMPAGSGASAGTWNLAATNVPFSFNAFYADGSRVTVTNALGIRSTTNPLLGGSIEGSFVGSTLNGAILGYSIFDRTSGSSADSQRINGVVAYSGPTQNAGTNYRDGLISDPTGALGAASYIRSFATSNTEAEVSVGTSGAVSAFAGPFPIGNEIAGHRPYAQGTAVVVDNGFDPTTGLVWGRWSGGAATIGGQNTSLAQSSLHYIFSPVQNGPVSLPLTGTATYDVVGSTRPTDQAGRVGVFNSASLSANFSAKTIDASVNITINGQTWNGSASGVPIYRDQYFSAYAGGPTIPGLPRPPAFNISCTPNCTPTGVTGSLDGFFTGRRGTGAGVMYNMNNNAGAIAFVRRGG